VQDKGSTPSIWGPVLHLNAATWEDHRTTLSSAVVGGGAAAIDHPPQESRLVEGMRRALWAVAEDTEEAVSGQSSNLVSTEIHIVTH